MDEHDGQPSPGPPDLGQSGVDVRKPHFAHPAPPLRHPAQWYGAQEARASRSWGGSGGLPPATADRCPRITPELREPERRVAGDALARTLPGDYEPVGTAAHTGFPLATLGRLRRDSERGLRREAILQGARSGLRRLRRRPADGTVAGNAAGKPPPRCLASADRRPRREIRRKSQRGDANSRPAAYRAGGPIRSVADSSGPSLVAVLPSGAARRAHSAQGDRTGSGAPIPAHGRAASHGLAGQQRCPAAEHPGPGGGHHRPGQGGLRLLVGPPLAPR